MRFRVQTEDTILLINRVIVLEAESAKLALEQVASKYPNSKIINIEESEENDR